MSTHKQENITSVNDPEGLIANLVTTYIAASGSESAGPIDMRGFAGGMVKIPAAWTAADLAFKVCESAGGTYAPLKDDDNDALIKITNIETAASYWYPIPDQVFSAPYVKLYSIDTADESAEVQASARDIYVALKG